MSDEKEKDCFLTTAQYWAEIPLSFRRFVRYEVQCNMINLFGLGILIKRFGDAENMKWDEEEQEHICPITETTITKCRKFIANSYDTYLRISSVEPPKAPQEEKKEVNIDYGFWEDMTKNEVIYGEEKEEN